MHEHEIFNRVSTVLVSNVLGSFLSLIRSQKEHGRNYVRKLCCDITVGLAALHRREIVHGGVCIPARAVLLTNIVELDLHTGNVGISLPSLNDHPPLQRNSRLLRKHQVYDCSPNNTRRTLRHSRRTWCPRSQSLIIAEDKDLLDEPLHADHGFGKWSASNPLLHDCCL